MTGNRKLQKKALCRRGSLSILKAQPIPAELTAKLLGNRVAVSPIVTVEPRRRKFHKPITLTIPVPRAANKGMINQYSGDAPTLRLLCSITGM
ncbi:Ankyrin-2 [Polyplax serrata]|uniref:Ankyrin-2 n=1 Tax=Polyplax serrata TaxID=468196 RepID=A0AAN8XRZ6_POLSC